MTDSTRNHHPAVTVATVATANMQSVRYTDGRIDALSARLDAIQVAVRQEHAHDVKRNACFKLCGDGACALIAAALAVVLYRCGLPHLVAILVGSLPSFAQVLFEFIRKV